MSSLKTTNCEFGGLCHDGRGGEIVKMGYLRKLKTMKKRFFILRRESSEASARLEYYEDEKKWKKNHSPRRTISLKTCFNINRRQDTKHKYVIALYTKDDCFGLVLDSDEELEDWLKALLSLQYGEDVDGEEPKPTFEHVWQVIVLKKGLGNSRNILGRYLLCLTDKSLSLVKMSQEEKAETYEFSLVSIRRCGHSDCFFYMEVGRSSCTGEGELWMQTEDTNIADNMHAAILHAMSNNSCKEELPRPRSSSTNEVSKPINVIPRRTSHIGGSTKEAAPPPIGTTRITTATEQDPQGAPTQGSGRERSDSVPSRPRTVSDGGPHPPHPHTSRSLMANRPHSVCWPSGSPISPASGPCSTDSPGSSLSIDEVEPEGWGVYGHSLTPDEPVIMEENEWSAPPLMLSVHKHSPSQEAYSPYGSSPLDPVGGYITMSPGTIIPETNINNRRHTTSSSNHSRASSVAEETPNGYVPMAPVDDGYVDMDPVEMSPSSSCSITSGTPSTDMRFSEYHLEKVSSYFTPSEEDETSSLDRPTRAYSVGSRPETLRRNNRLEIVNQADASRVRAFSVGSRTANKLSARAFAYDLYATRQHPTFTPPHHQLTPTPTSGGKKSLSAPLLCNSWSGGGSLRHHLHATSSSHSSMEPMDDLMEMDFTRNSKSKSKSSRNKLEDRLSTSHTPIIDGYVDMRPKQADSKPLAAASPPKSHVSSISPKTSVEYHAQSHPIPTPAKLSVSPKSVHSSAGPYMEMRPGSSPPTKLVAQRKISTVNPPSPEIKILNTQPPNENFNNYGRTIAEGSNFTSVTGQAYAEMKGGEVYHHGFQVASSRKPTSPIQEEYMDMSKPCDEGYGGSISSAARTAPVDTPQPKKHPEGYVEMAWTGGSKPSQRNEDYMNIAFEGRGNSKRKDKRKGRYSSQPIVIQAGENDSSKQQSSSTSPVFSLSGFIGRKHSSGTPPKVAPPAFLPLSHAPNNSSASSPSSSLQRNKSQKTNRRDSTENAGLTTPTGSTATIFPFSLNSPGSPMKPFPGQHQQTDTNYEMARKCPVDATSGTVRLSYPFSPELTPTTPDSSSSSSEQPTPVNAESLNDLNKGDSPQNHDYVNYSSFHRSDSIIQQNEGYGDYAIMRPVPATASRKISAPARVTTLMSDISLNSPARTNAPKLVTSSSAAPNKEAVQFGRPNIVAGSARGALRTSSVTKINSNGKISRQMSEGRTQENQSTRTGGAISRQLSSSSVGSIEGTAAGATGGSPSSSRPPSVSSERELHYASLDLAPSGSEGEEGSRSPRSIKTQGSLTESSTSSPSPNPVGGESTFTYAEIDFAKSEGLRSLNRKH